MEANPRIEQKTFYNLIEEGKDIVVPSYQRSYAQGRKSWDNSLERFLKDIQGVLDKGTIDYSFDLDFVYGGETQGFSPVDGQQRLTLLFLIHWYIFSVKNLPDKVQKLKLFKYKSRTSTGEFCENLVNKDNLSKIISFSKKGKIQIDADTKLSAVISDQWWFTLEMSEDPSVRSMLSVIDKIHALYFAEICKTGNKWEETLEKKVDNPLWFYHATRQMGVPDSNQEEKYILDLYIKINARGVKLTGFENVKAGLEKSNVLTEMITEMIKDKYPGSVPQNIVHQKRIHLMGLINTDYSNLLFNLCDCKNGKDPGENEVLKNDRAIMEVLKRLFWINFVSTAAEFYSFKYGVDEFNERILSMNSAEFIQFLDNFGMDFYDFNKLMKAQRDKAEEKLALQGVKKPTKSSPNTSIINYDQLLNDTCKEAVQEEFRSALKKALFEFFNIFSFVCNCRENGKEDKIKLLQGLLIETGSSDMAQDDAIILLLLAEFISKYITPVIDKSIPIADDVLDAYQTWERIIRKLVRNTEYGIKNIEGFIRLYKSIKANLLDTLPVPGTSSIKWDGIYVSLGKWADDIDTKLKDFRVKADSADPSEINVAGLKALIDEGDLNKLNDWLKDKSKNPALKKHKKHYENIYDSFKIINVACGDKHNMFDTRGSDGGIAEELIKAKLVLEDKGWKDLIEDAEDKLGSSIWFLLDMAKTDKDNNYSLSFKYPLKAFSPDFEADPDVFKEATALAQELFCKSERTIKEEYYPAFEKLAILYSDTDKTHLNFSNSTIYDSIQLLQKDNYIMNHLSYDDRNTEKYLIVINVLQALLEERKKCADINTALTKLRDARLSELKASGSYNSLPDWKKCFVEHKLIESFAAETNVTVCGTNKDGKFLGSFMPDLLDKTYTALFRTTNRYDYNMEMWSFALAAEITKDHVNSAGRIFYNITKAREEYIEDGFPNKYIVLTKAKAAVGLDGKLTLIDTSSPHSSGTEITDAELTKIVYMKGQFYIKAGNNLPEPVKFSGKEDGSYEAAMEHLRQELDK